MADGIEYTINVSNDPGNRITSLTRNGEEIRDDDEFTLCLCLYRARGGGNYGFLRDIPNISEIHTDMIELLRREFEKKPVISFEPIDNIRITK